MPKRVLVADDEPTIRSLLTEILDELGYVSLSAQSGTEALTILRHERPDALLLDMMMPDVNGWAVLDACRRDPATSGMPIVVLSTVISPEEARRLGADGCLTKPFDIDELAFLLDRLLDNSAPALAPHRREAVAA